MPPKKGKGDPPKVTKTAVDKTFGMKNKKGGAAQKQIQQIKQQTAAGGSPEEKRKAAEKAQKEKEKAAAEAARRETMELFKPVQVQKVPFGVDPKTVLCQFYKKGHCDKGKKCKFSHDLAVERKAEKRSLYTDSQGGEGDGEPGSEAGDERKKDDMSTWDEEKLRTVVTSKHGNPKTTTDKVCKHFIEAVENQKYGWFWTCPGDTNGMQCKYRHSLPPGFVLKTKEQRAAEREAERNNAANALTLEDFLDSERHKLSGKLTPVTPETFAKWKKERVDKKQAEEEARQAKEATGKRLFEQGGFEASDSEDEGDENDPWNLVALRKETEAVRAAKEEKRIQDAYGAQPGPSTDGGGGLQNGES